ncbi:MAG: hypothetical protein MRT15_09605 [archaeon YNP-LCB-003-016]|uniref:hypothetical protein n=1 Tax=Candidatus Culexarchaeum yellowstonense TaxID=2928963 RepID=UPI0026EDDF64|nr:hypothetical protein [Candidatus Culexarchaeum yellowstonense]MCR6692636.1 hypothetical protein [Candidatus Culexarchaeum yellowstonense]
MKMIIGFKVNVKKAVEFLGLSKLKSPEDFIRFMRNPAVVDGRRIYDPEVYSRKLMFKAVGLC